MRFLNGSGVIKFVGFSIVFVATGLFIGASLGSSGSLKLRRIEISYPDLSLYQSCAAEDPTPCAAESAALAMALAQLEAARQAAEDALEAWSDCVDANGGPSPEPNPNPPPRTVELTSVLETTK